MENPKRKIWIRGKYHAMCTNTLTEREFSKKRKTNTHRPTLNFVLYFFLSFIFMFSTHTHIQTDRHIFLDGLFRIAARNIYIFQSMWFYIYVVGRDVGSFLWNVFCFLFIIWGYIPTDLFVFINFFILVVFVVDASSLCASGFFCSLYYLCSGTLTLVET